MGTFTRFEDIHAWQNARRMTQLVYKVSSSGLFRSDYGLKDQIRRAAVSVMSNIAEGYESHTQPLFVKYLSQAKASAGEIRSQLYIAHDLHYISGDDFQDLYNLIILISKQLYSLIRYLRA